MKSSAHKFAVVIPMTLAMLFALYLALASKVSLGELIAGVPVAVIATAATLVFASAARIRIKIRFGDAAKIARVPWAVLKGTVTVLGTVMWPSKAVSHVAAADFDYGSSRPVDAGRRALATGFTTASPNTIVLDVIEHPPRLLYHQIVPGPLPGVTKSLGARP